MMWMHVHRYDFNNGTGHFSVPDDGTDWPDVGDDIILATLEDPASDSFGCVVTVTRKEASFRDGYLRIETDLSTRMMLERRRRDQERGDKGARPDRG